MSYIDDYLPKLYQWEGKDNFLYRDSKGLFTTMVGRMLPNLNASMQIPWYIADGSRLATPEEIGEDWDRVAALPVGNPNFAKFAAPFYKSATGLLILDVDIDRLTRAILVQLDATLTSSFPSFASAPDPAKTGLVDMAFNLGVGRLTQTYPHFDTCFNRSDWYGCAENCERNASDPAFAPRNAWTEQLFQQAAQEASQ